MKNGDPTLEVWNDRVVTWLMPTDLADIPVVEIVNVWLKMGIWGSQSPRSCRRSTYEIDFKYDEVLRACDKIQIFKLIKTIKGKHGLYATLYNPKFGIAGSGMHCNMSLFRDEGNNAFDPNDPKGMQLSETAYYFLGGLISKARLQSSYQRTDS